MAHRKTIRHYHTSGDLHELTFSCYQRRPLLVDDALRRLLSRTLDAAGKACSIELVAFVFMPEHVHLLVHPITESPDFGSYLARIKQPFSKAVRLHFSKTASHLADALTVRERRGKSCFRFWQEGPGFDRNIFSASAITASIDYIHLNPVRRQFCHTSVEWKWSSARFYLNDPPCKQDPDLPVVAGLPHGALD